MKDLFMFDLQLFAEEGGGEGGSEGGVTEKKEEDTVITFPDEKTFMSRVNREAKKQLEAQAKELGYETIEAMQAALKAAKEAKDKEKTDLEKEKAAKEAAEKTAAAALEKANQSLIRAEFKIKAKEAGALNPDAAYKLADLSNVGNVSGADEAIKALQKSDEYLFGKTKGGSVGNPSNPGGGDPPPEESLGEKLGKARAAQAKKQAESRDHYFK